jgi:hypothetical protein
VTDLKTERMPSGSAARRIRDFEIPFVPWPVRADHSVLRTHRDAGSVVDCPADGYVTIEAV